MPRPIVAPSVVVHWQLVNFPSQHTFNLFPLSLVSPTAAVIYPFAAVTICKHPSGLMGLVWHGVRRLAGLAVSWPVSLSLNRVRASVLCLPKGFSIESVKYHNLQSNQKLCISSFFFAPRCCLFLMLKMMKQPRRIRM